MFPSIFCLNVYFDRYEYSYLSLIPDSIFLILVSSLSISLRKYLSSEGQTKDSRILFFQSRALRPFVLGY